MYNPQIKTMIEGFQTYNKPNLFLSSFSKIILTNSDKIVLDKKNVKSVFAVDVEKGGARMQKFDSFSEFEYQPPYYNPYSILSPAEFEKKQYGKTEYEKIGNLNNYLNEKQSILADTIKNAIEKQVSDALFNNKINLIDGSEIVFNKKETHNISKTTSKWSNNDGNPIKDIEEACLLIIKDGKVNGAMSFNLILSANTISILLQNTKFRENSKFDSGLKLTDILMPEWNTSGAVFHGQFSCGAYRVNLWSYGAEIEIPTGFNFQNEGETISYIPNGSALLLAGNLDFNIVHAGIDNSCNMINNGSIGDISNLLMQKADVMPYAYWSVINIGSAGYVFGVKSRPLFIPKSNDAFVTLRDLI